MMKEVSTNFKRYVESCIRLSIMIYPCLSQINVKLMKNFNCELSVRVS